MSVEWLCDILCHKDRLPNSEIKVYRDFGFCHRKGNAEVTKVFQAAEATRKRGTYKSKAFALQMIGWLLNSTVGRLSILLFG